MIPVSVRGFDFSGTPMKQYFKKYIIPIFILWNLFPLRSFSQNPDSVYVIKPRVIDDILPNPGIGFMTFQRFNGDSLNPGSGWTEGFPIVYQDFNGNLKNKDYPMTTIAYWRVYWKFMEPEKDVYAWDMLDRALDSARSRGQTLMLRIAPYGTGSERDVPGWYRKMVGPQQDWKYDNPVNKWMVDPEDPRYAEYFGGFIRELGKRYDGNPGLESVDLSIVGAWGEGAGSELLSKKTREALVKAYTDSFRKTPLIALLMDPATNEYAESQIPVGWRADCLGDLGFWAKEQNGWSHMLDFYPIEIINCHLRDAWEKAPVSFEICGTCNNWLYEQRYTRDQVKYIFDQALKWHISSFNAKSSPVPEEYQDLVNDWLKKMGYRLALRRISYPREIPVNGKFEYQSWWENQGDAPCYKDFALAFRFKSDDSQIVLVTQADIRKWLPGDIVDNESISLPADLKEGTYDVQIAITDEQTLQPVVRLSIEGRENDGWYSLGKIELVNNK